VLGSIKVAMAAGLRPDQPGRQGAPAIAIVPIVVIPIILMSQAIPGDYFGKLIQRNSKILSLFVGDELGKGIA